MATPEEIRRERLRSDEAEMHRLHGDLIRVAATGDPAEKYVLRIKLKSILTPGPTYRWDHEVQIDLPPGYPWSKPMIRMLTMPPPFHPNWWKDGYWCGGSEWTGDEALSRHVLRMVRTLQFDPAVTNPDSPANREAAEWFKLNRQRGLFPCDRSPLPDPGRRIVIEPARRLELMPDGDLARTT